MSPEWKSPAWGCSMLCSLWGIAKSFVFVVNTKRLKKSLLSPQQWHQHVCSESSSLTLHLPDTKVKLQPPLWFSYVYQSWSLIPHDALSSLEEAVLHVSALWVPSSSTAVMRVWHLFSSRNDHCKMVWLLSESLPFVNEIFLHIQHSLRCLPGAPPRPMRLFPLYCSTRLFLFVALYNLYHVLPHGDIRCHYYLLQ